jgi:hypothetical protein
VAVDAEKRVVSGLWKAYLMAISPHGEEARLRRLEP